MAEQGGVISSFIKTFGSNETNAQTNNFERQWKMHNRSKVSGTIRAVRVASPAQHFNNDITSGKKMNHVQSSSTKSKETTTTNTKIENIIQAPNIPDIRLEKFQTLLAAPNINMEELKKLCWNGIPAQVRPECWSILTGYSSPVRERREATIAAKRQKYWDCATQYFNAHDRSEYEQQTYHQISIDVPRTSPTVSLFQHKPVQTILLRILYTWAMRHPASGYVQGINDLALPFFAVFLQPHITHKVFGTNDVTKIESISSVPESILKDVEADCYWCLTKFIDSIQDHYTFAQPGIQRMLYKLKEIVQKIDAPLHEHLAKENTEFIQFAFRWMNCLLMRELPLHVVIRLWDTYLSEGESFSILHIYLCAAFLVKWSKEIRNKDFPALMTFIQNLPTKKWVNDDIETLLSQAYLWKTLYNDSTGHLKTNKT